MNDTRSRSEIEREIVGLLMTTDQNPRDWATIDVRRKFLKKIVERMPYDTLVELANEFGPVPMPPRNH